MKIINPPDKLVMQLLGSINDDGTSNVRYLKWISFIPAGDAMKTETHLHNDTGKRGSFLQDEQNGIILHNYLTGETLFFDAYKDPEKLKKDHREHLVKGMFLVPEDYDDERIVSQLRGALRLMDKKKDITSFKILTTTDCNARCFYCYETGMKKLYMSPETADKTVEYIIKKSGGGKVTLSWFGGEPLLGADTIDRICKGLKCAGKEYISVMTSNGYLFDPEMIRRAVDLWHLNNIQITLDGTENTYNKIKAYRISPEADRIRGTADGLPDHEDAVSSPFIRVTGNIKALASSGVRVNVRLNLTNENFTDLCGLTDFLERLADGIPDRNKLNVYVSGLFEDMENDDEEKEKLLENISFLTEKIRQKRLESRSYKALKLRVSGCMADNDAHRGINPSGGILKCEHHIYDRLTGDIFSQEENTGVLNEWKTPMEKEDICRDCPAYPACYRLKNCPVSHICTPSEKKEQLKKNEALILKKFMEEVSP